MTTQTSRSRQHGVTLLSGGCRSLGCCGHLRNAEQTTPTQCSVVDIIGLARMTCKIL